MIRHILSLLALFLAARVGFAQPGETVKERKAAEERGSRAVRSHAMNPPLWSLSAYENVWKRWSKTAPADLNKAVADRYGLQAAPYDNGKLPMGLHPTAGILGKGMVTDCLLCHAGRVAGKTIMGAGNSAIDVQGLFDDLIAAENPLWEFPSRFSHVRGTINPVSPVTFLLEHRDADLNLGKHKLDSFADLCSDPPAWWLLKKKKTRDWAGNVDARSRRINMVNLLSPFNSADHIKKQEPVFADIHAFVLSVDAPAYPFAINAKVAEQGRGLFNESCVRCHGTYGEKASYPNKVVPLKTIGTDPLLARAMTKRNIDFINNSWLGKELAPDGERLQIVDRGGYQAPPLDGIWATAPFFHNGSAATLHHVLDSKARPTYFTRSFRGEVEDFDQEKVGLRITVLKEGADPKLPAFERRKIYDATLPGLSNAGHEFGDHFSDAERRAVIEYLKTL